MGITLFDKASTPADNGTNTADPTVITPPGSMLANRDLVVLIGQRRAASGTLSISQAGGQSWNTQANDVANTTAVRYFWCIFNGTWSANPSITMGAAVCNSAVMLVFRCDSGYVWAADVALDYDTFAAPGSPFTVTRIGITIASDAVAIASWHDIIALTWGSLSGSGWSKASLSAQYRNTSGSDHSMTFAYFIGSGATGDVSQNESSAGAGHNAILSFKQIAPTSVSLSAAALSAAGQAITVDAPSGGINVSLNAAALAAQGQTTTPSGGSVSTSLNAAALAATGPQLSVVPGAKSTTLNAAILNALGQEIDDVIPGAVTTSLNAAALSVLGQAATLSGGAVSTSLNAAALAALGQTISISAPAGGTNVNLNAAALAAQGQTITPSGGPVSTNLSVAALAANGQTITPQPGAKSTAFSAAALAAEGQAISISAPAGETNVSLAAALLSGTGGQIGITPGAVSVALLAALLIAEGQTLNVSGGEVIRKVQPAVRYDARHGSQWDRGR